MDDMKSRLEEINSFPTKNSTFIKFYVDKLKQVYECWEINGVKYLYRQNDKKCVQATEKMFEKLKKF